MKMTGHTTQKVFDGYYNVLDKDIMKVNDGLFNQELDQKKNKKSKSITSETEEQLKTLLRFKGNGNTSRRYLERESKTVDFLITCIPQNSSLPSPYEG